MSSIDSHILLAGSWGLYFALHSLLADLRIKSWFKIRLGSYYSYYRLAYNLVAFSLLGVLIWAFSGLDSPILFDFPGRLWLSLIVAIGGAWVIIKAFEPYDTAEFLGIKDPEKERQPLQTQGLHAYVRHPLYFGSIIFLLGFLLYSPKLSTLIIVLVALLYLVVGTYLEEKKLELQYGDSYRGYKKKVKMLIPFIF